jgi:membrane peptidoglycan carboxypeptidase
MSAQNTPRGPVLSAVLGMIAFSAVAAVLVTASVTPMIAVSSVTAQSAIGIFNNLPTYISIGKLPGPNTIYALSGGKEVPVATIFDENRQQVAWDKISTAAKDAAVDGEDRRFYSHGGVDVTGIIRAALSGLGASTGGSQQGASTISQQLVKNLSIQDALQEPTLKQQNEKIKEADAFTLDRKLKEAKLAISLEKKYSKQDILLAYLNIAPFGGTTYGIEAAAQRYYGTTAAKLTPVQSATLVAIVQNPNQKAPTGKAGYASNTPRRNDILGQMLAAKHISQAQYNAGIKVVESAKTIKNIPPSQGCGAAIDNAQFWCAYIKTLYPSLTALGSNAAERAKNWKIGGYKIYTTLDVNLQQAAQTVENTWVPATLPTMDIGGATTSVEVGTGRILVMVENRKFNEETTKVPAATSGATAINYAVDQKNGGSAYGFQGGSTYKPFTLINWLQHGHGLNDIVDATPNPNLDQAQFKDRCEPDGWGGTYGKYTNDEGEKGPHTVMNATANSINGVFLNMGKELDQCDTRDDAVAFGVHQGHTDTSDPSGFLPLQHQPSAILGTNSVAPLTMAAAYAGIANGGVFCKPIAIDSVISPEGQKLPGQPKDCSPALDPGIDAAVGVAMQGVFSGGTAGAARPAGVAILGKTGTTNKSLETWTVGSTTRVSTAVWVGNATGQVPTRVTRPPVHCPGTANQVATLRNCVFKHTMEAIDAAYPPGKFPPAPAQYLNGTTVALADYSGQTVTAATAQLQALGFDVNVVDGQIPSAQPVGTVAYTDPGPGLKYAPGYLINIYVSDGTLAKTVPNVTGLPFPAAKAAIAGAGFTTDAVQGCVVTADPTKVGKAISTDPIEGWQGPAATTITVQIGKLVSCP